MSKSKKNTIDPELMIKQYGADAVRWFILSDSPPEKDIQWSDTGVSAANKFLQKIWNLNSEILKLQKNVSDKSIENKLNQEINEIVFKIDKTIEEFKFNVSIALFYEAYKKIIKYLDLKISKKILCENITKIMKLMVPFAPHIAHECLEMLNCKNADKWPKIEESISNEINLVIQVNGKTRDVLKIEKDLSEKEIYKKILYDSKAKKFIEDKRLNKTIFIKNKIINYIVN